MLLLLTIINSQILKICSQLIYNQIEMGCLNYSGTQCMELCTLGQFDCTDQGIICEYGYFLQNLKTCVLCPYQNINDKFTLYCMDCIEHPYTWQQNRSCTYEYKIEGGDEVSGTYIKNTLEYNELYFIGASTYNGINLDTIQRNVQYEYEVFVCSGCKRFCNPNIEKSCNEISSPYKEDMDKIGIECLSTYEFKNQLCKSCPPDCLNCLDGDCIQCMNGYMVVNNLCQQCSTGCTSCYLSQNKENCIQCQEGMVTSLEQTECESCGSDCRRCEYATYNDNLHYQYPTRNQIKIQDKQQQNQYVKRCRQCTTNSLIHHNGIDCVMCSIPFCDICYYQIRNDVTTLDYDFEPSKTIDNVSQQQCFKCLSGFILSDNKQQCQKATPLQILVSDCDRNLYVGLNIKCQQCNNNIILDQFVNGCFGKCTAYINNCDICFSYKSLDQSKYIDDNGHTITRSAQTLFQCSQCNDGYFPNIFTGYCDNCSSNCKQCWQYSQTYNFTEFLFNKMNPINNSLKETFMNDIPILLQCTQCFEGYQLYNNQCLGCTSNCQVENPNNNPLIMNDDLINKCIFKSKYAFCGQCYDPFNDRSLVDDKSECTTCPLNCLACRERLSYEITNPYFNPENANLLQYGRLCYKIQTLAMLPTITVTYNTLLNIPILCRYNQITSTITKKCKHTAEITVTIYCNVDEYNSIYDTLNTNEQPFHYSLDDFYYSDIEDVATINFYSLENFILYQQMNQAALQGLNLYIKFYNTVDYQCQFTKSTKIKTEFHKNVYALNEFKVYIQSAHIQPIQFQIKGSLQFPDFPYLKFSNFQFYSYQNSDFNIQITNSILSSTIYIDNCIIGFPQNAEKDTLTFNLNLQSVSNLIFQDVTFQNLNIYDTITIDQQSLDQYKFSFTNLYITNSYFQDTFLFDITSFAEIVITNLQILNCNFVDAYIFSNSVDYQQFLGSFTLNQVLIKQSYFFKSSGMVKSNIIQNLNINGLDIIGNRFNETELFASNTFNIKNVYVYMNVFTNDSRVFVTSDEVPDQQLFSNLIVSQNYVISNLKFIENTCFNINCIMIMKTPYNSNNSLSHLILSNLYIYFNYHELSTSSKQSVSSAMILLYDLNQVKLDSIIIDSQLSITVISLQQIQSLEVETFLCDWSRPIVGPKDMSPKTKTENTTTILYPFNNKLPFSQTCSNSKLNFGSYNSYCIHVQDFLYGVKIKDASFKGLLGIDNGFVFIQSYQSLIRLTTNQKINNEDQLMFYYGSQNEMIILDNINIFNTSIATQNPVSNIGAIVIKSEQIQTIIIQNIQFIGNHLHQLVESITLEISPCFTIISPNSIISINNLIYQDNRATQSMYGINVIKCQDLSIESSIFNSTNQLQLYWMDRIDEFEIQNYSQLIGQFAIESVGSNLWIQCKNLSINNSQFLYGNSLIGSSFYFLGQDMANINITYSEFRNQSASLEYVDQSKGGAIYLNLEKSQYKIIIDTITMSNCVSRTKGGCIYIETSMQTQHIQINNSQFSECQSITSSLLDIEFSISTLTLPSVYIGYSNIFNNNFYEFLKLIPDISYEEELLFLSEVNIISQNYGLIEIQQTSFYNLQMQGILSLTNLVQVIIQDCIFKDNVVFYQSLIQVTHYSKKSFVQIQNIIIQNITESTLLSQEQMVSYFPNNCDYLSSIFEMPLDQTCSEQNDFRTFYTEIYDYLQISQTKLDNSTLYDYYGQLSDDDKYLLPEINLDSVRISTIYYSYNIKKITNKITQLNYELCYLSNLVLENEIQNELTFIKLTNIKSSNFVNITSLTIQNSNCKRCQLGLVLINSYDIKAFNTVYIFEIICQYNNIGYYGCLIFSELSEPELVISYSNRMLSQQNENRILTDQSRNYNIILKQSLFQDNIAQICSGICVFGLSLQLIDTNFYDNKAYLIGGGLLFMQNSNQDNILDQYNNQYLNNYAQLGSSIYMINNNINNMENSLIVVQGDDTTTQIEQIPIKLSLQINNFIMNTKTFEQLDGDLDNDNIIDSDSVKIVDIVDQPFTILPQISSEYILLPSGQQISQYKYYYKDTEEQIPYEWQFRIVNLDKDDNIIQQISQTETCIISGRLMDENNLDLSKTFQQNFTSQSTFQYDTTTNSFNMDKIQIYFDPYLKDGIYLQLKVSCSSIKIPIYNQESPYNVISHNTNYFLYINIKTIPCQIGEAYQEQKCVACDSENTYSVQQNSVQCKGLNSVQMEQVTPVRIKLNSQYWRPFPNNDEIEQCYNYPTNCQGGWVPGDTSCYEGHIGALCEQCDIYGIRGPQYSVSKKYTCGACNDTLESNILIIIGISLFTLITMILSVKGNYQFIETLVHQQILQSIGARINTSQNNASIIMKQLTNYLQIIAALSTFRISIPTAFVSSMEVLGNPTSSMAYSLDCFLVTFATIDLLYFRMAWALLMPLFYMIIFFFGYFTGVLVKLAPFKIGIIYTTFIYMFIYLQPTLVGGFIALLSSRVVSGIEWVQSNVSYQYNTDLHQYYILIFIGPNLFLWSLLLPLLFMHLIRRNKDKLENMEVRKRWGFFYHEYTKQAYLWEFVKIFEKELVIIALTYYENKIVIKGLIIFLIVFIYGAFSFTFIPYKQKKLNFIDQMSTAVCSCSLCLGVLIYASQNENLDYLQYIMFLIIALMNSLIVILILFHLLEGYINQFDDKLDIVRVKLKSKYPNLDFQYPCLRKLLINKKEMKEKVGNYWAILRYQTRERIKRRRQDKQAPLIIENRKKSTSGSQDLSDKDFDVKQGNSIVQQDNIVVQSPEMINSNVHINLLKRPSTSSNLQGLIVKQSNSSQESSPIQYNKIYPELSSELVSSRKDQKKERELLKKRI